MDIREIPSKLESDFNLRFDYYFDDNDLYLKLNGLDSRSLREYIEFSYNVAACLPLRKCISRIKVNNQYIKISEK